MVWATPKTRAKAGNEAITQLYNAAKKEGTVVIWGPTDAIIYQRMQEALDKQYPGIKIEHFESIPEPLVQRIIAESQAGKPAAVDVIQSGSLRALRPLIDRDMLAPYPGWEKDFGLDAVYANQRFVGAYNLTLPISYNTKMVSAKEAPKSWEDLADPKWKGKKIIIEARLVPFAMLGTEWGKPRQANWSRKYSPAATADRSGRHHRRQCACRRSSFDRRRHLRLHHRALEETGRGSGLGRRLAFAGADFRGGSSQDCSSSQCRAIFCGVDGNARRAKDQIRDQGQAMEVGRNAIGNVAERIRSQQPAIILETDKTFTSILEIQRELGKLLGALR